MSRKKSTRQLIGIDDIKNGSVVTADGELAFYFVHPSNLNVLPEQGVRAKVQELLGVLKGMAELELLALDSRESFLKNKQYYQRRLEEEPSPALRELLRQDMEHLDARQSSTAAWTSAGDISSSLSAGSPSGVMRLKEYPFSSAHCCTTVFQL